MLDRGEMPEAIEEVSSLPENMESKSETMPDCIENITGELPYNTADCERHDTADKLSENRLTENVNEIDNHKNCPVENGAYEGERGESKWKPDPGYIPLKGNPEAKTWQVILSEYNIDGIEFQDGEPDFDIISKGNVEIDEFSEDRTDNFDNADIELAKEKGCNPEDVEKWRKDNNYTWHECRDMRTMQKVPSIVHNNISHRGGISEIKTGG